jgi:hypothetical protein
MNAAAWQALPFMVLSLLAVSTWVTVWSARRDQWLRR